MGGRVVFPIKDETMRWLSWHARTFCDQDKRYKNAAREDGYDPGAIFGMRWWPPVELRQGATLALTEGAIDALACERAGARFIGAIGGSEAHARQLLKLQPWGTILVATDGDQAGDNVFRSLRHALGRRCSVRRVDVPRGTDAGKLAETPEGTAELRRLLCLASVNAAPSPGWKSDAPCPSGRRRRRRV